MTGSRTAHVESMYRAHVMLRREFGLVPGLIRKVAERDVRRSEIVGDHVDLLYRILHAHHEAEDWLMWPLLLERCDDRARDIAPMALARQEQLDSCLETVRALLAPWRTSARGGVPLAMASTALNRALAEHIVLLEGEILPLAEHFVTAAEWRVLDAHSRAGVPARELPLYYGMAMHGLDPESLQDTLAELPRAARVLMLHAAPRAYAKHTLRVHGTRFDQRT
jgi:hypothetical protein